MLTTLLISFTFLTLTCGLPTKFEGKEIPRYMLRLYQEVTDGLNAGKCGYNTVRNLKNHNDAISCQEHQLSFNLSAIPYDDENTIEKARIHLELDKHLNEWRSAKNLFRSTRFRLHMGHGSNKRRFLAKESEPTASAREITFNITRVVLKARQNREKFLNMTLMIHDNPPLPACSPTAGSFRASLEVETSSALTTCDEKQPAARRKRSVRQTDATLPNDVSTGICQLYPLSITFQDIGWDNWIVEPRTYDAYFCGGSCPFPINDHLNASNHAVVQNLIHSFQPRNVPPACCAPTKLGSMSMLYYDHNEELVLRVYEDMIVEECGCQ